MLTPLIDPRGGDLEDDFSSTKQRSLLGIAGSLLAEISFPKLIVAWALLIVLPGLIIGIAPLITTAWVATLVRKAGSPFSELWPLLALPFVLLVGWIGGRPLFRVAEQAFWSLNSLAIHPGYALCREALQHLAERLPVVHDGHTQLRAWTAASAGFLVGAWGLGVVFLAWPYSRWIGAVADLAMPQQLLLAALANAAVALGVYVSTAGPVWGIADAGMRQPRDLAAFDTAPSGSRTWRIAHLSDLHCVGERYGFRIESGRSGAQGNDRLSNVLARLHAIHAERPLDFVLVTGDMTDCGRSAEWAELLRIFADYPDLAERTLFLPGNHDVNVVDRANPARLDLPTSPARRLRQVRALSAMAALQGDRAQLVDPQSHALAGTLTQALVCNREALVAFADTGGLRQAFKLARVWDEAFPMVILPDAEDGLGVILFNSTAETHFSFTNALGLLTAEQMERFAAVTQQFPQACWIVALHHHLVEYPRPAKAFSERIGTALINGSWVVRQLQRLGPRLVVMHGHRHIDWFGECGTVRILSAPSPVMEAADEDTTHFYIHTLAATPERLCVLTPEQVDVAGTAADARP